MSMGTPLAIYFKKMNKKPKCMCHRCQNRRISKNNWDARLLGHLWRIKDLFVLTEEDLNCECIRCVERREYNAIRSSKRTPYIKRGPGKFAEWDRTTEQDYKEVQQHDEYEDARN